MILRYWKDGKLQICSGQEFTQSLRRFAEWSDEHFSVLSDPSCLLSERLNASADALDALYAKVASRDAEIMRLREALEFYSDPGNSPNPSRSRAALKRKPDPTD